MKELPHLIYYILIVISLLSAFIRYGYHRRFPILKSIGIWSIIIFVICCVHLYRDSVTNFKDRILANLVPGHILAESNKMTVTAAKDGHFYIYVTISGRDNKEVTTSFMIDTGASSVVIPLDLAKEIGIDVDALQFIYASSTANGQTMAARSSVQKLKVGDFVMHEFPVLVIHSELNTPLLGLDFLQNLRSYKFEGEQLVMEVESAT